jgi:hypothetical protein
VQAQVNSALSDLAVQARRVAQRVARTSLGVCEWEEGKFRATIDSENDDAAEQLAAAFFEGALIAERTAAAVRLLKEHVAYIARAAASEWDERLGPLMQQFHEHAQRLRAEELKQCFTALDERTKAAVSAMTPRGRERVLAEVQVETQLKAKAAALAARCAEKAARGRSQSQPSSELPKAVAAP